MLQYFVSAILLFVKDLDDRIFPLLGDFSRYPNVDKDVVKALDDFGVIRSICQAMILNKPVL